jgi:hypothetical protein
MVTVPFVIHEPVAEDCGGRIEASLVRYARHAYVRSSQGGLFQAVFEVNQETANLAETLARLIVISALFDNRYHCQTSSVEEAGIDSRPLALVRD